MTAFDRFDPFERRISEAIDEIAAARLPDYLDDILRQTARTAQRPRWTFPERWLPVDTTLSRPTRFGRLPFRQLIVLALLVALAAAALAFYVGSQKKLRLPVRACRQRPDRVRHQRRPLRPRLARPGRRAACLVGRSRPGRRRQLARRTAHRLRQRRDDGVDHAWVANADGSNPRQFLAEPLTGLTAQWISPDSRSVRPRRARVTRQYDSSRLRRGRVGCPPDRPGPRRTRSMPSGARRPAGVLLVRTQEPEIDRKSTCTTSTVNAGGAILSNIRTCASPARTLYGSPVGVRGMAFCRTASIADQVVESGTADLAALPGLPHEAATGGTWARGGALRSSVALQPGAGRCSRPTASGSSSSRWVTQTDGSAVDQLAWPRRTGHRRPDRSARRSSGDSLEDLVAGRHPAADCTSTASMTLL